MSICILFTNAIIQETMKKHLLFVFLGALACCSCSNSYDLLENDAELAKAAEDYELMTRAVDIEADSAKIETIADEQTIQTVMDEYEQELMNRQSVAKERVMRTAYAATTDVVGVFKVGSCGTYKELTLHLDAEDTRQNSKVSGSVGDTSVDGNGNVNFKFCLTEANRYYPGGVFLVDHINYSLAGGTMKILVRYHDCDDKHNKNSISSTDTRFSSVKDLAGYTIVDKNAALAWAFPPYPRNVWAPIELGPRTAIKYGLLAGGSATRKGTIYVDDEDSSNENWLKKYVGYSFQEILSGDQTLYGINATDNTRYYVVLTTDKEFVTNNIYHPNFGGVPRP